MENKGFQDIYVPRATPQPDGQAVESYSPTFGAPPDTRASALPMTPQAAPKTAFIKRSSTRIALVVLLAILLIGSGYFALTIKPAPTANSSGNVAEQFSSLQLPLNDFALSQSGQILGTRSLTVNGNLQLKGGFVISPSGQPSNANPGQIYYDQTNNQLSYYNGSQFVNLTANVQSLQGQTGAITLVSGPGIAVNGTTLSNIGVRSLGGQTGDITIGTGLSSAGGSLHNTGLLGAASGTPGTLGVVNDGNGNITISSFGAGTGTVQSPGGTVGRLALFTGAQQISDSIIDQSGSTITVTGNLSVVSGGLSLSSALTVGNGGTGATSLAAGGVVVGNGPGALSAVTAGGPGLCLISTGGAPTFTACPGGSGVLSLNGLTGALSIANASGAGSVITIDNASTATKGIASFNPTNFTVSLGAVNTIQDINTSAAPTFGRLSLASSQATNPMLLVNNTNVGASGNLLDLQLNGSSKFAVAPAGGVTSGTINGQTISSAANLTGTLGVAGNTTIGGTLNANGGAIGSTGVLNITPTGTLTLGSNTQTFSLQGNVTSSLAVVSGANSTTVNFQAPTAVVTYRFPAAVVGGTYDICSTAGNCAGTGGGVTTSGGTPGRLALFTGAQQLSDSIVSQSGVTVTVTGNLSLSNALTVGNGGTGATSLTTNGVVVGNGFSALSAVAAGGPGLCLLSTGGAPAFAACPGSTSVTSLNGLNGALSIANASGAGSIVTIDDASTATKGIASFNPTNFSASLGVVNTIQDINTTAAPTFGRLSLASNQATNPMLFVNNTNVGAAGNLLDLQLNGSSKFAVSPAGNVTGGTINGQTINATANFTGTLGVAGTLTAGGVINANGGAINSTGALNITPTGQLTLGSTSQVLSLQGGASSSMVVVSGVNSTTVNFQAPTAVVTYRFPAAVVGGTYDICSTAGNCAGTGGGVTSSGGTPNRVAKFTAGQAVNDSTISDNGTVVSTTANLVVQGGSTTVGVANSQSGTLTLAFGGANFSGSITQGTLTAPRTYTLPDVDGTVCLNSGNCLGGGGGGANVALSNLTGVALNTSLIPGSTSIDLGSSSAPFRNLFIAGTSASPGTNNFKITGVATAPQTITLPDATGTVCLQASAACGFTTGSGVAIVQGGNTLGSAANIGTNDGFALNLRTGATTQVTVATSGNTTFNADIAVNGGDITSPGALNITPGGLLTVGATGQALVLQGNASTQLTASGGGFTTTVGFTGTPTASVIYNFDRTATAGPYTICTTANNCSGVGGGVTVSSNGTTGTLPVFTGAQTIADSLVSQSGSVVTANGDINLTTGHVFKINAIQISSANLSNDSNLAKLSASQTFTGNTNSFKSGTNSTNGFNVQNAAGNRILTADTTNGQIVLGVGSVLDGKLVFANASNANTVTILPGAPSTPRNITLPNSDGIICLDSGNCNGAGATLQTAYNFSAGGTTPKIKVNSSLLGVDIQDADTTIAANLFNVRASNGVGLGQVMFGVSSTGQTTLQNSANSATAFRVLNQSAAAILTGDTQNSQVLLGQGGSLAGSLGFRNATNSNVISLVGAVASGPQTITLPDATGTVCLTTGNCLAGNTLQAAYDAGNTILATDGRNLVMTLPDTTTDPNFLINLQCDTSCSTNGRFAVQDDGVDTFTISPAGGAVLIQNSVNSTTGVNVKSSGGSNIFTVDTVNSRIGVNLGGSLPTLAGTTGGAEILGSLRLSGSGTTGIEDTYTTPLGSPLGARFSIVNNDPSPSFGQQVALGLPATAATTNRVLSLFDARDLAHGAHQPSLAVFSPLETQYFGLSWDGSETNAYLKTSSSTLVLNASATDVLTASTSAISLNEDTNVLTGKNLTVSGGLTTLNGPSAGSSSAVRANTGAATNKGLVIQGASSQTADLFQLQDATTANIFRLDSGANLESIGYFNNGYGGLGQFQNLLTFSEQLDNAAWAATSTTVTADSTVAPDGTTTGDTLAGTGASNVQQTYTTATNGTYTFSIWLRSVSGTVPTGLRIDSTGATPTTGTVTSVTATTSWQRFNVTQTFTGTPSNIKVVILPGNGSTGTVIGWGAQLVQASLPLVYSRTTSSTVALNRGVVSNGGAFISSLNASDVPLVVQSAVGQSGDLVQIQNSAGAVIAGFNSAGTLTSNGINVGTGAIQGTGGVTITSASGTIAIGNNAVDHATTVGSVTGSSLTTLQGGSSGVAITTGGNIVLGTSDTTGSQLVLDTKTSAGDPTGVNGGVYYSTDTNTFRCYENGGWTDCISRHKIVLGSDVTDNTGACTLTNITGLSFSVKSGTSYRFYAQLGYTASSSTTGSEWAVTGPSNTFLAYRSHYNSAGGANGEEVFYSSANDDAACNTDTPSTTASLASIDGMITPSANGTLQLRFGSEINGLGITVKAGSTLEWW